MLLPLCVPNYFTIRTILHPSRCTPSRVDLFIVTGLAFIPEVLRVQADGWIVAVVIVQPDLMMDDQPRLSLAYLAGPTIYSQPVLYICSPGPAPRL